MIFIEIQAIEMKGFYLQELDALTMGNLRLLLEKE
jgi:hypothetical protein